MRGEERKKRKGKKRKAIERYDWKGEQENEKGKEREEKDQIKGMENRDEL